MKNLLTTLRAASCLACVAFAASALAKDITIFDGQTAGGNAPPSVGFTYAGATDLEQHLIPPTPGSLVSVREDNETEPTTYGTQAWDLEAVDLRDTTLTIVGGYRFDGGTKDQGVFTSEANNSNYFYPGDIFIDVNGAPNPNIGSVGEFEKIANSLLNFDYVIAFDAFERGTGASNAQGAIGTGNFSILKLGSNSLFVTGKYIDQSSPFRYLGESTGTTTFVKYSTTAWQTNYASMVIGTGTATFSGPKTNAEATTFINSDNPVDLVNYAPRSLLGDTNNSSHYYLTMDIASLLEEFEKGDTFGGHLTMGCGNDEMAAWLPPSSQTIPDGGLTVGLLGLALLALRAAGRKFC